MDGQIPTLDFDAMPDAELDAFIASGGKEVPETKTEDTATTDTSTPEAKTDDVIEGEVVLDDDKKEGDKVEETKIPEAEEIAAIEKRVAEFTFTENAPVETIQAEETEYLELVELPAPLTAMITRRDAEIERLSQVQPMDKVAEQHMTAFNHLASEYKQAEDGSWVPDTAPARELLQKTYPKEFSQLVEDRLAERSAKYPSFSRLHEIIMDDFGISEQQMEVIDLVLRNGGNFPRPSYLPEGIDRKYLDAYWYSSEREEIEDQREQALIIWRDPQALETEKMAAKQSLINLNQKLAREQRMMDSEREKWERERQIPVDNESYAREQGLAAYNGTIISFIESSVEDLAKQLAPTVGEIAAKADAAAFAQLMINAFSDADDFAKLAQKQLEAIGIKAEWATVAKIINQIYQTECKIKYLEKIRADQKAKGIEMSHRAVELETGNKENFIRELTKHEKSVKGQFLALKVTDSGEALKKKITAVPTLKKKEVVRPKIAAANTSVSTNIEKTFNDMSLEDLNKYIAEEARKRRTQAT